MMVCNLMGILEHTECYFWVRFTVYRKHLGSSWEQCKDLKDLAKNYGYSIPGEFPDQNLAFSFSETSTIKQSHVEIWHHLARMHALTTCIYNSNRLYSQIMSNQYCDHFTQSHHWLQDCPISECLLPASGPAANQHGSGGAACSAKPLLLHIIQQLQRAFLCEMAWEKMLKYQQSMNKTRQI